MSRLGFGNCPTCKRPKFECRSPLGLELVIRLLLAALWDPGRRIDDDSCSKIPRPGGSRDGMRSEHFIRLCCAIMR